MSRPRFLADLNEHIVTGVLRREPLVDFVRNRDIGYDERPDADPCPRGKRNKTSRTPRTRSTAI